MAKRVCMSNPLETKHIFCSQGASKIGKNIQLKHINTSLYMLNSTITLNIYYVLGSVLGIGHRKSNQSLS